MKRLVAIILAMILLLSISACGLNNASSDTSTNSIEPVTSSVPENEAAVGTETEESCEETSEDVNVENDLSADMAELEAIGDVEVEEGILTVSVTLPADFVGDEVSQESLDTNAGENYQSAKFNEDGSVTYKMTKEQHRVMLDSITESTDQALQKMIDDDKTYSITGIKHNNNYSVFDVTMDADMVGLADSFSVIAFYMYGGMYGIFSGDKVDNVVVNFYDSNGNLIQSGNSTDMSN